MAAQNNTLNSNQSQRQRRELPSGVSFQSRKESVKFKVKRKRNSAPNYRELVMLTEERCFTTSLIVAKIFEKEHKDVLKAIRELMQQLKEIGGNGGIFALVEYKDAKGEMRPMYEMDRDTFSLLVMGFTGEKALKWKLKFLDAFNHMEQQLKKIFDINDQIKSLTTLPLTVLEFEQLSYNDRLTQQNQFHEIMSRFGLSERGCKLAHIRIEMCKKVNQEINGMSSYEFRNRAGIVRGKSRDWMPLMNQYALYRTEFDLLRACRARNFEMTLEELDQLYVRLARQIKDLVECVDQVDLHRLMRTAILDVFWSGDGVVTPYEETQQNLEWLNHSKELVVAG